MAVTTQYTPIQVETSLSEEVAIPFTWPVRDPGHVQIKANDVLVPSTMYEIESSDPVNAPNDFSRGGVIIIDEDFMVVQAKPVNFLVERITPLEQPDRYAEYRRISNETLEASLDNLSMQIQEVENRSVDESRVIQVEADMEDLRSDVTLAITTEATARQAADQQLQTNINNEATARAAADDALGARIDAEVAARIAGDNNLTAAVQTEAAARAAADVALGDRITTEVAERMTGDAALLAHVDYEVGRVSSAVGIAQATATSALAVANNHSDRHATGGADALAPADIGAMPVAPAVAGKQFAGNGGTWTEITIPAGSGLPPGGTPGQVVTNVAPGEGVWADPTGGGGPGVSVHNDLTGRDAADAHPIGAVTGLVAALAGVGTKVHGELTGREAPDSHPIAAVTGLQTALDSMVDEADIAALTATVNGAVSTAEAAADTANAASAAAQEAASKVDLFEDRVINVEGTLVGHANRILQNENDIAEIFGELGGEEVPTTFQFITNTFEQGTLPNTTRGCVYANGLFVVTSISGTNQGILYSADGVSWNRADLPMNGIWYGLAYGNDRFVGLKYHTTTGKQIGAMYSTDGVTWEGVQLPTGQQLGWSDLAFGNGVFVSADRSSNKTIYSSDGVTWTNGTSRVSNNGHKIVTFGNGRFVIMSHGYAVVCYSTDGITWTSGLPPPSYYVHDTIFGGDKFVAVGNSKTAMYSADGHTWTATSLPTAGDWESVAYGGGRFVAFRRSSNIAAYSDDGITWTQIEMPVNTNWSSGLYGNGKFTVIGSNSTYTAHATWPLPTPPVTGLRSSKVVYDGGSTALANKNLTEVVDYLEQNAGVDTHNDLSGRDAANAHPMSAITDLDATLALKAPLAAPLFTGNARAPTVAAGTNSTRIATTAFVQGELTPIVTRIDTVESVNAAQDVRITTLEQNPGGGGPGTMDHRDLTNRDAADSHPVSAITGLDDDLDTIASAVEANNLAVAGVASDLAMTNTSLGSLGSNVTTLTNQVSGMELIDAQQNLRLDTVEAVNTEQNGRLSSVETMNTTQNNRLTSVETVNTTQNGRLDAVEADVEELKSTSTDALPATNVIGQIIDYYGPVTDTTMFEPDLIYADGHEVSRTTYGRLFIAIGTTYGSGDGVSTFNVPDLRGQFTRGIGGNAAALGVVQGDAIRNIKGESGGIYLAQHSGTGSGAISMISTAGGRGMNTNPINMPNLSFDASRVVPTADENRPTNMACHKFIVARASFGGGQKAPETTLPWSIGQVVPQMGPVANPAVFEPTLLFADGRQTVSRTTYAELFATYGTTYGAGDGSTTFGIPDLRGVFLRGLGGESAALGVKQGDAIREIEANLNTFFATTSYGLIAQDAAEPTGAFYKNGAVGANGVARQTLATRGLGFKASRVVPTANENRPTNMAVNYFIFAKSPTISSSEDFTAAMNAVNISVGAVNDKLENPQIMHVREQQPSGTTGGTFTAGAWRTRNLNTLVSNSINDAVFDSATNSITLSIGTYEIDGWATAYGATSHRASVATLEGSRLILGSTQLSNYSASTSNQTVVRGVVEITEPTTIILQHWCLTTVANNGFGYTALSTGYPEIYAELFIRRIK